MASPRSLIHLGAALTISMVAGLLMMQWMAGLRVPAQVTQIAPPAAPERKVVVAAVPLARGTKLVPAMLRLAGLPAGGSSDGTYAEVASLEGMIVAQPMAEGELMSGIKLTNGGVGAIVSQGKRAMAVRAGKVQGLSGAIKAGTLVDVLVTMAPGNDTAERKTKVVLETVPVILVEAEEDAGQKRSGREEHGSSVIYTLELTPEEAEKLALATTQGEIHFAVRNPSDGATVLTKGADFERIVTSYSAQETVRKRPAAVPAKPFIPEAIRGTKRESPGSAPTK